MACCQKFDKYLLMVINVILLAIGWFLIGAGLLLQTHVYHNLNWIAAGVVTSVVSSLGFWGAYKEKPILLKTYAWIILVALCLKVLYIIFTEIRYEQRRIEYENMFHQYGSNHESTLSVDLIQQTMKCCGFHEPHSMQFENGTYPWSCCDAETDVPCTEPAYFVGCAFLPTDPLSSITRYLLVFASISIHISCALLAFRLSSRVATKRIVESKYLSTS